MYLESNNKLQLKNREKKNILFCFDEKEIEKDGNILFTYEAIRVPLTYNYAILVSTIIKEKYSDDKMQAIINNYLMDITDTEHKQEFIDMQQWRAHAKEIAKEIINNNNTETNIL